MAQTLLVASFLYGRLRWLSLGLLMSGIGAWVLIGGVTDWDGVMGTYPWSKLPELIGRVSARVVYVVLGLIFLVAGIIIAYPDLVLCHF